MTISVVDRIRLESMLGMLGSNHVGERDNAAKLIAQFLQRRGLTWPDVLGRYAVGDDAEGKPKTRPNQAFWKPQPRAAYTGAARPGTHAQDVVWRWSMLIGLVIVGSISLMSLIQQRAADPRINADIMAEIGAEASPRRVRRWRTSRTGSSRSPASKPWRPPRMGRQHRLLKVWQIER
jgi:hypothetical protein